MSSSTTTADWITAIGTALGGGAAFAALWFGVRQFRRGGFTYRVRTSIDEEKRVIRVAVLNTGRMQGEITYIEVLNRGSMVARLGLALRRQRGAFEAIDAKMQPSPVSGSRTTTTPSGPIPTGEVSIDLQAGYSFVVHVAPANHRKFVPDKAKKGRWLLVRVGFGDGRVAEDVPRRVPGTYRFRGPLPSRLDT